MFQCCGKRTAPHLVCTLSWIVELMYILDREVSQARTETVGVTGPENQDDYWDTLQRANTLYGGL